jgi:hypothetical protein
MDYIIIAKVTALALSLALPALILALDLHIAASVYEDVIFYI